MKDESTQKNNQNEQQGFPIQAKLLLAVMGIAVLALFLKISGIL